MKNLTEKEEQDFYLANHVHIGEELTLSVNPYGKLKVSTIGGLIEPLSLKFSPKVTASIGVIGLTPEDYREMADFFNKAAEALENIQDE